MAAPIPAAMCNAHYKVARGLSLAPQKLRQLGDIRRDPARLTAREQKSAAPLVVLPWRTLQVLLTKPR